MSTKNKKVAPTGIRYTDAQKQEIVDFVAKYNADNGRGGQSAASKKYKVTQLTIAGWIKSLGGKSSAKAKPAAAKPAAASAAASAPAPAKLARDEKVVRLAKPAPGKSSKGIRYTPAQKQEVIDFVTSYNAANGRGGQSHAAKRFGLSVLTVSSWLKSSGAKIRKGKVSFVNAGISPALTAKVQNLISLGEEIRKVEAELQTLRAKYESARASVQSAL